MKLQLYKKVAEQILRDYSGQPTLPGERQLADRYVCARTTIRLALKELQTANRLESSPRDGHRLVSSGDAVTAQEALPRRSWNVVMVVCHWQLEDQNFLNFMSGVFAAARQHPLNLIVRTIHENIDLNGITSLALLHPGLETDAYILTSLSERLRGFAENQLKPCIVLGDMDHLNPQERRRFVQILQPTQERIHFLLSRLGAYGHRRILAVAPTAFLHQELDTYCRNHPELNLQLEVIEVRLNTDSASVTPKVANTVWEHLKDHTALLLFFGGATSLAIIRKLEEHGVEIPRRLSLAVDSGRFDYYIHVNGITSIYFDTRSEGQYCIEELVRQLFSGQLNFECRMASHCFRSGNTIAPPMISE